MRNLNLVVFVATICLLVFSACSKSEETTQFNFENFKLELQNEQIYSDYISVHSQFLTNMVQGNFDLITIITVFEENEIKDFCAADHSLLDGVNGADLFFENHCELRSNLNQLLTTYPVISNLSKRDFDNLIISPLFPDIQNADELQSRQDNCLAAYTAAYKRALRGCASSIFWYYNCHCDNLGDFCHDRAVSAGSGAYDKCCAAGGSQC